MPLATRAAFATITRQLFLFTVVRRCTTLDLNVSSISLSHSSPGWVRFNGLANDRFTPRALRTLIILLPPSREILLANDSSDRDIGDLCLLTNGRIFVKFTRRKVDRTLLKLEKV